MSQFSMHRELCHNLYKDNEYSVLYGGYQKFLEDWYSDEEEDKDFLPLDTNAIIRIWPPNTNLCYDLYYDYFGNFLGSHKFEMECYTTEEVYKEGVDYYA